MTTGQVVFLLEEPSMQSLLEELLPRLVPGWVKGEHFLCVKHEGKTDLDRSIPRKLASWRAPGTRFVVVRDNDNADCVALKQRLVALCAAAGRPDTVVRLVCQELESWYIGDLQALARAFPGNEIDTPAHRKRYVHPDEWRKPCVEVERLVPTFQKRSGAREMGRQLTPENNRSPSFKCFVTAVQALAGT